MRTLDKKLCSCKWFNLLSSVFACICRYFKLPFFSSPKCQSSSVDSRCALVYQPKMTVGGDGQHVWTTCFPQNF